MKNLSQSNSLNEIDWDFYLYAGNTVLGWSLDHFWNVTPAHLLKQYIMHIRAHNPDELNEIKQQNKVYTLDQTPFM